MVWDSDKSSGDAIASQDWDDQVAIIKYMPQSYLKSGAEYWEAYMFSGSHSHNSLTPRIEWNQNGFENRTDSTLAWTDSTPDRTLSVQPVSTSFDYWISGTKHTTTGDTHQIADTMGIHAIYYDGGSLTSTANPTTSQVVSVIENTSIASYVYWNSSSQTAIYVGEERHGKGMSPETHNYLHWSEGMRYNTGLGLNSISSNQNGDSNHHAQFGVDAGSASDEDLYLTQSAITSTTGVPVYYMSGNNAAWYKNINSGFSVLTTGTGRLAYNQNTSGDVWKLTEVSNNYFVLCHIFVTTEKDNPIISLMGQSAYSTRNAARNAALTEIKSLVLSDVLFPEIHALGTVIFQTNDSYGNTVKALIKDTQEGDDYVDWRSETINRVSISTTDHGSLTGLGDDDHTQYYNQTRIATISSNAKYSTDWLNASGNVYNQAVDHSLLTSGNPHSVTATNVSLGNAMDSGNSYFDGKYHTLNDGTFPSQTISGQEIIVDDVIGNKLFVDKLGQTLNGQSLYNINNIGIIGGGTISANTFTGGTYTGTWNGIAITQAKIASGNLYYQGYLHSSNNDNPHGVDATDVSLGNAMDSGMNWFENRYAPTGSAGGGDISSQVSLGNHLNFTGGDGTLYHDGVTGTLSMISGGEFSTAYAHSQIAGGNSVHVSITENSNWDTAYTERGSNIVGVLLDWNATVLDVDLTELADGTEDIVGSADEMVYLDAGSQRRKQIDEIKLSQFNNDSGWTASGGTVDTSGTPVDNDYAKFTDADTIEGRSYSEMWSDISSQAKFEDFSLYPPMTFNVATVRVSSQQNINVARFFAGNHEVEILQAGACDTDGDSIDELQIELLSGSTSVYATSGQLERGKPLATADGGNIEIRFMYSGAGVTGVKYGSGFMQVLIK